MVSVGFMIGSNSIMWLIYHVELPFFERYKINPEPWPWHENKEEWNRLVKKSILLVGFNNLVVLPLTLLVNAAIHGWDLDMSFEIADLPDTKTLMMTVAFCMMCEDIYI